MFCNGKHVGPLLSQAFPSDKAAATSRELCWQEFCSRCYHKNLHHSAGLYSSIREPGMHMQAGPFHLDCPHHARMSICFSQPAEAGASPSPLRGVCSHGPHSAQHGGCDVARLMPAAALRCRLDEGDSPQELPVGLCEELPGRRAGAAAHSCCCLSTGVHIQPGTRPRKSASWQWSYGQPAVAASIS